MPKKIAMVTLALITLAYFSYASPITAQEYYKGKTIRIIVGFSAGGGFDAYSRAIDRNIGKHIPWKPCCDRGKHDRGWKPYRGQLYMYSRAKPDGLTIGNFHGGLVVQQLLGRKGVEFDARKFEWIGLPVGGYFCLRSHQGKRY